MSGEIHRLKSWTDYRQKLPPGATGMLREGYKTQPGYHTVVAIVGHVREDEEVTEEWFKARLREMGWVQVEGE